MELGILSDAKNEFTEQIILLLTPRIYEGIRSIFELCKKKCSENNSNENSLLPSFQILLSDISKWNNETIMNEYERIEKKTNCKYLEDLLTAVFISHTRVLSSIRNSNKKKNINLKIPKIHNFIHKCYINTAREFWKYTYLFNETNNKLEVQKNMKQLEDIIKQSILLTIRKLLPVYDILREYLMENIEETLDESSDEEKDKHLQYLIRSELNEFKKQEELNQNKNYNNMLLIENNENTRGAGRVRANENNENNENNEHYNLLIEQLIESNKDDINNEELLENNFFHTKESVKDENTNKEFNDNNNNDENKLNIQEEFGDSPTRVESILPSTNKSTPINSSDNNKEQESVKENNLIEESKESVKENNLIEESKESVKENNLIEESKESVKENNLIEESKESVKENNLIEESKESVKENIKNIIIDEHIDTTGSKKKKVVQSQKKSNIFNFVEEKNEIPRRNINEDQFSDFDSFEEL